MALISYQNVAIEYEKGLPVIKNVSFSIPEKTITAFLGPNGSGKTTLMTALIGLIRPCEGEILLNGRSIHEYSVKKLAAEIAYVPQFSTQTFDYTAAEMVMWGRAPYIGYRPGKEDVEIVMDTMRQMQIDHLKNRPFNSISGGEKQMVMIARALSQQTPVILMDEPATYLDLKNQKKILNIIRRLREERNITFVLTLHDPNHALYLADHVLMVSDHTAKYGAVQDLMTPENLERLYGVKTSFAEGKGEKHVLIHYAE